MRVLHGVHRERALQLRGRKIKSFSGFMLILSLAGVVGCGSSRLLNEGKVKDKLQHLGMAELGGKDLQVTGISQTSDSQAVAETRIKVTFQFHRAKGGDWQAEAIRLGDRDWVEVRAFLQALNGVRAAQTRERIQKLVDGIEAYRREAGHLPVVNDIIKLTDLLVPAYMDEVIRYDGWNKELTYRSNGPNAFQLSSSGADGIAGNNDDITIPH
jgi:hypothetical protein